MIKFIFWTLTISIISSGGTLAKMTRRSSTCDKAVIVLDPNMGLGKINCTDTGEYSRNGCNELREDGNLVCKLTPLEKPQNGKCYHMQCTWKEQDNYKLSWDIKPPYNTIYVTMTPELDLSPGQTMFSIFILLGLWLPFACAYPEIAFLICLGCDDRDTRYGSSSKLG
jgi:hypothetical protein